MANQVQGYSDKINFFAPTLVDQAIQSRTIHHQQPSLISSEVIEFNVEGSDGSFYTDLHNSTLKLEIGILDSKKQPVTPKHNVALVNLPLHSVWNQIDFYIGNTLVSRDIGNNYAYKAIIDTLLNHNNDSRETELAAAGLFLDSPGFYNHIGSENIGFYERSNFTKDGGVWQLESPVLLDEFGIEKYLPGNLSFKLKFWKNCDDFCLLHSDGEKYYVHIESVYFKQHRVNINPSVLLAQNDLLKQMNASYTYPGSYIKQIALTPGSMGGTYDNFLAGKNPYWVCVSFIDSEAVNGKASLNPFNFENCNICEIGIYKNNEQFTNKPYQPDFERGHYVSEYLALLGKTSKNSPNFLTSPDFKDGCCLFVFNQAAYADSTYCGYVSPGASFKLEFKFKNPLKKHMTCLIYAKFYKTLEIDFARNVYVQ